MLKISWIPKVGRRGVLTLILDEDPWLDIHTAIFGREPAINETYPSLELLQSLIQQIEYKGAYLYTLKKLSLKSYATTELTKSLKERLVSQPTIEKVIEECQRLGYLNDKLWIESYVRSQKNRNAGQQKILYKLRSKGISKDIAHEALQHLDSDEEECQRIQHLLSTKYSKKDLSDFKSKNKVVASLMRKGYALDNVLKMLGTHFREQFD